MHIIPVADPADSQEPTRSFPTRRATPYAHDTVDEQFWAESQPAGHLPTLTPPGAGRAIDDFAVARFVTQLLGERDCGYDFAAPLFKNAWTWLTVPARQLFRRWEQSALKARRSGHQTLPPTIARSLRHTLLTEVDSVPAVSRAIEEAFSILDGCPSPVPPAAIVAALAAALESSTRSFGREFRQVAYLVDARWHDLGPGARAAFTYYDDRAVAALGDPGALPLRRSARERLLREMYEAGCAAEADDDGDTDDRPVSPAGAPISTTRDERF